jgi:neurofibromin 1
MFRALCHYIWESVEDRYPESRHSAVGSFIFLRFFCPAIVAPDNIDLEIPADSRDLRRGLLMITKVIQNLANNVVFGNKEPHMKVLNTFLGENIRQVTKFLSDVAIRPRSHEIAGVVRSCRDEGVILQDAEGDDLVLNRFVRKHLNKLETALSALPNSYRQPGSDRPERTPLDGRAALTRLRVVLEQTGVPVESRLSAEAQSLQYEE